MKCFTALGFLTVLSACVAQEKPSFPISLSSPLLSEVTSSFDLIEDIKAELDNSVLLKNISTVQTVNTEDQHLNTPLHYAVLKNNLSVAEILLKKEANVNKQNKLGDTPLHFAVQLALFEMAQLLVEHEADIHIKNKFKESALELSERVAVYAPLPSSKNKKIFELLKSAQ